VLGPIPVYEPCWGEYDRQLWLGRIDVLIRGAQEGRWPLSNKTPTLKVEKENLREAKPPNKLEGESKRSEAPK